MTNDIAYFMGLWIAEGSFEEKIGRISITCGDNVGEILNSGKILGLTFKESKKPNCDASTWRVCSYELMELFRYLKMPLVKAPAKWIPEWVWRGKKEWACELLAGMLDGDGYVLTNGRNKVGFTTASERLAKDIQLLLTNLGIVASLTSVESRPTKKVRVSSVQYRVELLGKNVAILRALVRPRITRKRIALDAMDLGGIFSRRDGIPHALSHLESIKSVYKGVKLRHLDSAIQTARNGSVITYEKVDAILEECSFAEPTMGYQALKRLRNEWYFWDKVESVEDSRAETFDFTIPDTHSFWSNGFISHNTPKAFNFLYELYVLGQKEENISRGRWISWQFPTSCSPFIPRQEIEEAKRDMDEKSYRQEFEASFEAMSGRVYHAFDRNLHVAPMAFDPTKPIWIGQDFNIDPMSSVIMQPQEDGSVHVIDEVVLQGSNTEETTEELEKRYWRYVKQCVLFPDPAGQYRQHARGETDLDIFKEKGFKRQKYHRKHPAIADRVNSVNRMLKSADGRIRLRVDPKCKHLIESLEQTIYKRGSRDVDKDAGVEHSADALGYCIQYQFPIKKIELAGVSI
ncbi:LAGLIDADG family homing endonuclease [Castellaniella sp.]|uniref:LAGLIDADG family homing endonuclease n=1 Tax=Castellaniella sp. TaxID=1955812 RepID=UPI002AFDEA68|nr:LAGLIDADG family homing endonuclease [Castellaniella sp.]